MKNIAGRCDMDVMEADIITLIKFWDIVQPYLKQKWTENSQKWLILDFAHTLNATFFYIAFSSCFSHLLGFFFFFLHSLSFSSFMLLVIKWFHVSGICMGADPLFPQTKIPQCWDGHAFGALCRKMNLLCDTPLPCCYCQSQLNLVCVSESMCAQGQRVYPGRGLRHSSHMCSNLNKLHIFVPWILCRPVRFGLGLYKVWIKSLKRGKQSNTATKQQQGQTAL